MTYLSLWFLRFFIIVANWFRSPGNKKTFVLLPKKYQAMHESMRIPNNEVVAWLVDYSPKYNTWPDYEFCALIFDNEATAVQFKLSFDFKQ